MGDSIDDSWLESMIEIQVLQNNKAFSMFGVISLFSCIFILLSRESDQCAIISSLIRSYRLSVYHTKIGQSRLVPFPTAQ